MQPFSPFWFTVEPQDTLVFRGNSALLNCSAHSDEATPVRLEWKKDGTFMSLRAEERRRVLPDGSLLFTHVVHSKHNKPDEGTYQCIATISELGSISSRTARLSVAGEPLNYLGFGVYSALIISPYCHICTCVGVVDPVPHTVVGPTVAPSWFFKMSPKCLKSLACFRSCPGFNLAHAGWIV